MFILFFLLFVKTTLSSICCTAMAAEHDALEEQNALRKVEAAKTAAKRSVESAILKRRRAQILMENADLAIYKAMVALRIAEGAQLVNSADVAVQHILD